MISKTVSHYKIIEEIGVGGMGVVYKAEDTKLKRTVALKFLPPELTSDAEAKSRFIREAQAASAFDHPNICTIYEINETDDGQIFIVMAFYEGETLKEKIKEKSLKTEDAIGIAIQIAEGLVRAHEEGIVHRDIKPANILITDRGEVKILDFGLAKLSGQAQLTKDSSTLGTVAYMSPEQVGGKEVDQRTDIWSLGVVIYEMLTGELPFAGAYEQAIIYAILNEEPKRLENISSEPQEILKKSLMKNQDERYVSVADLLNNITNIRDNIGINIRKQKSTKSAKTKTIIIASVVLVILISIFASFFLFPTYESEETIKSLAVLPFVNLKSDTETDYLGDAFAAEIIRDLTYLKSITVLPYSTVREIKKWEDLNVDYILSGNYLKELNNVRLNIELVNKKNNEMIWQGSVEEKFENTFKLQDIVSAKVIDGLKINFSSDERNRMISDVPKNSIAFDYYQLSLVKPTTTHGNLEAIALLEKSIKNDSTYAPAFNQIGFRIHNLTSYNLKGIRKLKEAETALNKALQLNPELLSALGNLARIFTETGRLIEADRLVKKMLFINQNNAFAHFVQGYIYRYAGLLDEASSEMEKAVSLDPSDKRFRSLGITYYYLGEYEKALKAFDIDKGSWYALTYQGLTLVRMGKNTIAKEYFTSVVDMDPESFSANLSIALKSYIDGKTMDGLHALLMIEQENPADSDIWYLISGAYALLGDKDGTLRAIEGAVRLGFYVFPLLKQDPYFDFVRNEPEFQKMLSLAKEKHEAFKQLYYAE